VAITRQLAVTIGNKSQWFAHRDMQKRVAEGLADITAGRTRTVRTPAGVRAYLRRLKGRVKPTRRG
jgi:hypothetical protein